jgi:hypothetical protein
MISSILQITATSVTVIDAIGAEQTIPITLTPRRLFLTQATKRAVLSTGFLLRYGEHLATDKDIINAVLEDIRREVLRHCDGVTNEK